MSQRRRAELEQNRADILAMLEEAEGPVRLDELAATVHGLDVRTCPGYRWDAALRHTSTDLRALHRAGKVAHVSPWSVEQGLQYANSRWALATPGALTPAEERADVDDLRRQIAGWEPVPDLPEVPC